MAEKDNWLDKLVQDLHLDDTAAPAIPDRGADPPDDSEELIGLTELLKRLDFTDKGWAAARQHLHAEFAKTPPGLFQSVVDDNPDDFRMFLALIQAAYLIAKELRYNDTASEKLGVFYALAFAVAIHRGIQREQARLHTIVALQSSDPRLWGDAETSAESLLQTELRRVHEAVEDDGR